jgi:hypothetical protein
VTGETTHRAHMRVRRVSFGRRYEVTIRTDIAGSPPDPSYPVWRRYWTRSGALRATRRHVRRLDELEARRLAERDATTDITSEITP